MSKSRFLVEGNLTHAGSLNAQYNTERFQSISIRPVFQQWVVVDVIFDPTIIDQKKIVQLQKKYETTPIINLEKYALNKVLPRNTIIAKKVIRLEEGVKYEVDKLMLLYPFFPSALSMPCKPGEHVWVMFENLTGISDMGYWMCGVVGSGASDDVNHSHYPRILQRSFSEGDASEQWDKSDKNGSITQKPRYDFSDRTLFPYDTKIYERILTESESSFASVYESIPRFKKRPGDIALEGSNNTLIVLGRDRTGKAVEYTTVDTTDPNSPTSSGAKSVNNDPKAFFKKRNAGSIDMVVGRGQKEMTAGKTVINELLNPEIDKSAESLLPNEGDPDFKNDRSRIYISQNTEIDKSLELQKYNSKLDVKDSESGDSGIVIKTDKIRIFARSDVQILVTGFDEEPKITEITQEVPEGLEFLKNEVSETIVDKIKNQKSSDTNWASITIKSNGDIVFKPSEKGYIKLGDETADRAILCTDTPAVFANGKVNPATPPIIDDFGSKFGGTQIPGSGTWAKKILVTGAK